MLLTHIMGRLNETYTCRWEVEVWLIFYQLQTTSGITERERECSYISIQNQFSELIYQDTDEGIVPWYSDWSEESSVSQ